MSFTSQPTWSLRVDDPGADSTGYVNHCSISHDASLAIAGTFHPETRGNYYMYGLKTGANKPGNIVLWKHHIDQTETGIFWTALSHESRYAAFGGETKRVKGGFLSVHKAQSGKTLFKKKLLPGRVNQIAFTPDDRYLLVTAEDKIIAYSVPDGDRVGEHSEEKYLRWIDVASIVLERSYTLVSGRVYPERTSHDDSACYFLKFNPASGTFSRLQPPFQYSYSTNALSLTSDEQWAALGSSNGMIHLFRRQDGKYKKAWKYHPGHYVRNVGQAYGLDLAYENNRPENDLLIAGGVTRKDWSGDSNPGGSVFLVKNHEDSQCHWRPEECWVKQTNQPVNPGVTMPADGSLVTACDGHPVRGDRATREHLSPGNFYLFNRKGSPAWKGSPRCHTDRMNWSMSISLDGSGIIGGIDDGKVYFWRRNGGDKSVG